MLDPVIGRWLSPDPARQYHSPYVSMGNNPVNMTDPDGAFAGDGDGGDIDYVNSDFSLQFAFLHASFLSNTGSGEGSGGLMGFASNYASGFGSVLTDTWDSIVDASNDPMGSLFDAVNNLVTLINPLNREGDAMRAGVVLGVYDAGVTATELPSMSANEAGFTLGRGTGIAAEALLLSKGTTLGLKISRVGIGQTAFESRLIGGRSALFGRGRLGSFNGNANGILNRGYLRIGWSFRKGTHYFQPRLGPQYGATHYAPWFTYKP